MSAEDEEQTTDWQKDDAAAFDVSSLVPPRLCPCYNDLIVCVCFIPHCT